MQSLASRDRGGTGYVTLDDVVAVLRSIGVHFTVDEVEHVLQLLNIHVDGFGKLNYKKFVSSMKQYMPPGAAAVAVAVDVVRVVGF
jgi:Ca2+-binding EF-hand superfamily protein